MDAQTYKNTLKRFASGVTVLSWRNGEQVQGITVSAFSALSLDPPLVLFCITKTAFVYPELTLGKRLAINILAENQVDMAYQFAGANRENLANKINEEALLHGTHAGLVVEISEILDGGDHSIFIAKCLSATVNEALPPLIYYNGKLGEIKAVQ